MNNIEDKSEKYCTGCSVCATICPVNAIEYKMNKIGFYETVIDEKKCIKCGRCKKVCIKFNETQGKKIREGVLYSGRSRELKNRQTCTSGGVAFEIAKYGIENGYKVLGTIYDNKINQAKAIVADSLEQIELFKGSKYIQSNMYKAIERLIIECKNNEKSKFIVFGLPCQIAGITKLIQEEKLQNEIIKIDLFCHGVPSYTIWENYIEELKKKYHFDEIVECDFRSKYYGWHQYCIRIKDKREKEKYISSDKSDFYKIFFDDMLLNRSCYNCIPRMNESNADLRLGDFWGKKYYIDQEGISSIVVPTHTGENLIQRMLEKIEIIEKENIQEWIKVQSIEPYKTEKINHKYLDEEWLKGKTLKQIIKGYKKNFTIKKNLKRTIKGFMGLISPKLKYKIKRYMMN